MLRLLVATTGLSTALSAAVAGFGYDRPAAPQPAAAVPPPGVAVVYAAPVPEPVRVVRGFEAPATRFGPGHRGVDLASQEGGSVTAAAAGTVTFAGMLAGRGVVVIAHADGVSTEYEPVTPTVRANEAVTRGELIGSVHGRHGDFAEGACVHWGARRGGVYIDPLSLLEPLGVVRLLPTSG